MNRRARHLLTVPMAVLLLAACGSADESEPAPAGAERSAPSSNLADLGGDEVCPSRLPEDVEGVMEPATAAPSLPAPDIAWVCRYDLAEQDSRALDAPAGAHILGATSGPVGDDVLQVLSDDLAQLEAGQADQMCTMDIGPRWMLVYASQDRLAGVVADGYGCREVRATAGPFGIDAGGALDVPSGVLGAPTSLLEHLEAVTR